MMQDEDRGPRSEEGRWGRGVEPEVAQDPLGMVQYALPSHVPSSYDATSIRSNSQKRPVWQAFMMETHCAKTGVVHQRIFGVRCFVRCLVMCLVRAPLFEKGRLCLRNRTQVYLCGHNKWEAPREGALLDLFRPLSMSLLRIVKCQAMQLEVVARESPLWKTNRHGD